MLVSRIDSVDTLLSLLTDTLACLRTLQQPGNLAIPEGRQMEVRLRLFLEQKLLRKSFTAQGSAGDSAESLEIVEALQKLFDTLREYIKSPQAALHPAARLSLLTLSKMASVSKSAPLRAKCVGVLLELQSMYFDKKRVLGTYGPFVEEVFTKMGDFAVAELLPALVQAIGSAKSHFLKSEACRILSALLRQSKGLKEESRVLVLRHCPEALRHIAAALTALGDKGTALAKLARPLLNCAKDLLMLLGANSANATGKSKDLPAAKTALVAALEPYQHSSTSPIVVSLATVVLNLLEGGGGGKPSNPNPNPPAGGDGTKPQKKRVRESRD